MAESRISEDGRGEIETLKSSNEALRQEVARLQQEVLRLKQALEKPPRTSDDFANAVSHSLDSLQTRLGQLKNPVSNFAVRELTLEAKVYVEVTALGTINYRFVQPGDEIPEPALSKLSLTLCPIPRTSESGTYAHPDFTPLHEVDAIQGIGERYRERLNRHQIYTVSDLLNAGSRARSKVELAALLEVDRNRLDEWLSHAELLTVRDIDGRNAEILHSIGVTRLAGLAEQESATLAGEYNAEIERRGHATLEPLTSDLAQKWIDAARAYVGYRRTAK